MAAKLSIADLDFDAIKSNLKDYLRNQSEFSDFDFEGAGLNILLDVLAYNTHYNSFYMNMIANEMFMDSAALRQSVVSHAKLLGYTPRSNTASMAVVNVEITRTDSTTQVTLPRFTTFISQASDGVSYSFVSVDSYSASNVANTFTFSNVEIREGIPGTFVYTVDSATNPKQIFELPDDSIDTSTLQIIVQKSATETSQNTYTLATDSTEVTTTSEVYYLEEGQSGKYRIYFGDDIFGKKLSDGNLVVASYVKTKGSYGNGLNKFKLTSLVLPGSTANVQTVIKSSGGSLRELVEDIKFSAPKSFISNNRAVTKNDYITMINKKYPYFDAVNVWGGEEEETPVYGKVFIAAKPQVGFEITETEKEYLKNEVIKPFSILTVKPEFVDVNYNYLLVNTDVTYDPRLTSKTSGQLELDIKNAIKEFSVETLNTFTSTLKFSKLLKSIDDTDVSIVSSTADIFIEKRFSPIIGNSESYILKFNTPLTRGATAKEKIYSTPAFEQTDSSGILRNVFFEETPESFTGIESVQVLTTGTSYTKTPTITIIGDGEGAVIEPVIVNGKLQSVNVLSPGSGYTTAILTVENASGDFTGTGATAKAIIHGKTGILRSFYYNDIGAKKIMNANAGTIDYETGTITIDNFSPEGIINSSEELRIAAKPLGLDFKSQRSTIITLDRYDSASIVVNLKTVTN